MKRVWATLRLKQKVFAGFSLVIILFPVFIESPFFLTVATFIALYGINAVAAGLTMGYTGQLMLAFPFFYGIGAYSSAILTTTYHLDPWLALVIGVVLAGSTAYILGLPIVKLGFLYMGMVTFGILVIGQILMGELTITGGRVGIWEIPPLCIAGFAFDTVTKNFYLAWAITLAVLAVTLNIVNSRTGRALKAIASNELAASVMGINIEKYKNQAHVIQAVYCSIAGSLYANFVAFVDSTSFGLHFSLHVLMMVCVGGMFSVWGALLGAFLVTILMEILRTIIPLLLPGAATSQFEMILYGIGLIVVIIYMPTGLMGWLSRLFQQFALRRHENGAK